jgi:hypothetical protein
MVMHCGDRRLTRRVPHAQTLDDAAEDHLAAAVQAIGSVILRP